ncbi:hypothetical protein GJR96_11680 [Haloferax sp. MBLA0076]|uniref:Uncharacterized protein n=1 Tax=Haloferax litoreum TaxID=2666140 RepID=A0A6A8GIM8_9EURY|nr:MULTISPECIES: hypothetical protein [Haloferax]KAB1194061.1 hypothetical protein Hfx1148_11625 [Haloferax sp. CBA1148]MRX22611.1 hypothetical protein [Haloferax litoreum]
MRGSKLTTAVMVIAMLTVAMVPGTVGAATTDTSLQVDVEQDVETGNATVTVTQNETTVENATVSVVESSVNYSANNTTYTTGANGTVELPNPDERVNVTLDVTAGDGNNTTTTSVETELVPHSESLDVTVETDDENDTVTATVTQYGDAVENASVQVNGTDYDNTTKETDANGTVEFTEPVNTTNLTFVASANDATAESTVSFEGDDLSVAVEQDENASVVVTVTEDGDVVEGANVTVSGNYTDAGDYVTDENGTVHLADPLENVTVTVTAEYGDQTAETTATLQGEVAEDDPFGVLVSTFVERLKSTAGDGPMGQAVSDFVTENNPGKADEKRPEHAGPKDKDNGKNGQAAEKGGNDDKQGPPEHAGNDDKKDDKKDDDEEEESSSSTEESDSEDDSDSNGPPEHAKKGK